MTCWFWTPVIHRAERKQAIKGDVYGVCMPSHFSHVWLFVTPWTMAPRPLCPWDSPGKNTGEGCHALLQGIILTQGQNLGLLHCRQFLYCWVTGEEGTKLFLRIPFHWFFYSQTKLKFSSPFYDSILSWRMTLRHCHWKILYEDGSCPRMSEYRKTFWLLLGKKKGSFPNLFPRENSSLSRDKCWTEMGKKAPRVLWLSHSLPGSWIPCKLWQWQSWMHARLRVGGLLWDLGLQCSHL